MRHLVCMIVALSALASGASAQEAGAKAPQKLGTVGQSVGGQGVGGQGLGTPGAGKTNQKGAASDATGANPSMAELVSRGYEIKAAVPNGGKFIVFMQKDQSAYACEFQSLTGTRCGSIN